MTDAKECEIIGEWDGPVCANGDRWFEDLDECVEYYWDDCYNSQIGIDIATVPEFVECCDAKLPTFSGANWIIENIDENHPMADECPGFADHVGPEHADELNKLVNQWIERVGWKFWIGKGKFIRLRPLVEEYERECERRNRMCEAMDYAEA